jgi:UPF0271 protein
MTIDLNCDMGESFGAWRMGDDEAVMPFVSSVNIACGFHAGDPTTMWRTVEAAARHRLAIGAHPGYPDLQGFGRREMRCSPQEVYDMVLYQIGALAAFAQAAGQKLRHVKPHGALYNTAARDAKLAEAVAQAVRAFDASLVLYGLAGSVMISEAQKLGLRVAHEVFADRTYQADGSLTPRSQPNAMQETVSNSVRQVLSLAQHGQATATDGTVIRLPADTVCIHGDGPNAVATAEAVYNALRENGIGVAPPF